MFVAYIPSLITMLATVEPRTKPQVQVSPLTPLHFTRCLEVTPTKWACALWRLWWGRRKRVGRNS